MAKKNESPFKSVPALIRHQQWIEKEADRVNKHRYEIVQELVEAEIDRRECAKRKFNAKPIRVPRKAVK